jgi:hypothetical protein
MASEGVNRAAVNAMLHSQFMHLRKDPVAGSLFAQVDQAAKTKRKLPIPGAASLTQIGNR